MFPLLVIISFLLRFKRKKYDIGLGPEPLINYVYHKQALILVGFTAKTFVTNTYFITEEFDFLLHKTQSKFERVLRELINLNYFFSICEFKCIYTSFNGCCLKDCIFLWRLEPFLYKLANVKIVILPYGSDVQDMTRSNNLLFKDAMSKQYPLHKLLRKKISKKIDLWTAHASHIVSGCEWVDYMTHWDTLTLGHFSISTQEKPRQKTETEKNTITILHAPNHRIMKGTDYVREL